MTSMQRLTTIAVIVLTGCTFTERCPEGTGKLMQPDGRYGGECVPFPDASTQDAGDSGQTDTDAGPCGGCSGATPLCREDGECVACLSDDECGGQRCDTEAGECVGCLVDADCTETGAARCDLEMQECAPCTDSGQCEGIAGHGVCGGGECVECTTGESGACGGNPCKVDNTCSSFPNGAQRACQPCDADENCAADHYCVPMQFEGADRPGGYCLKSTDGGCTRPFGAALLSDRTSLSGAEGLTFCGINETLTTCEAVRALLDDAMCPGGADDECPEGGICRTVGAFANRCTYECDFATDCLSTPSPASTCGDGTSSTGPDYCGG